MIRSALALLVLCVASLGASAQSFHEAQSVCSAFPGHCKAGAPLQCDKHRGVAYEH
jgi:hypothetical protein